GSLVDYRVHNVASLGPPDGAAHAVAPAHADATRPGRAAPDARRAARLRRLPSRLEAAPVGVVVGAHRGCSAVHLSPGASRWARGVSGWRDPFRPARWWRLG